MHLFICFAIILNCIIENIFNRCEKMIQFLHFEPKNERVDHLVCTS